MGNTCISYAVTYWLSKHILLDWMFDVYYDNHDTNPDKITPASTRLAAKSLNARIREIEEMAMHNAEQAEDDMHPMKRTAPPTPQIGGDALFWKQLDLRRAKAIRKPTFLEEVARAAMRQIEDGTFEFDVVAGSSFPMSPPSFDDSSSSNDSIDSKESSADSSDSDPVEEEGEEEDDGEEEEKAAGGENATDSRNVKIHTNAGRFCKATVVDSDHEEDEQRDVLVAPPSRKRKAAVVLPKIAQMVPAVNVDAMRRAAAPLVTHVCPSLYQQRELPLHSAVVSFTRTLWSVPFCAADASKSFDVLTGYVCETLVVKKKFELLSHVSKAICDITAAMLVTT